MPNWASTDYVFQARDEKQAIELENHLNELAKMKEPLVENGFGVLWFGCLVNKLGGDWQNVYCRGEIQEYRREADKVYMYCITAWGEPSEFRHFIESCFPDSKVYFCDYEPGLCVYATNDVDGIYFPSKFCIETDEDSYYPQTIEEAAKCVGEYLGKEIEPDLEKIKAAVDEFVNGLTDSEEDKYKFLNFNEIEICDD